MRVAIITESFPPDVNGVAHCVVRVAELLAARGHQPLVIAPKPPRTKRSPEEDKDPGPFPYPVVRGSRRAATRLPELQARPARPPPAPRAARAPDHVELLAGITALPGVRLVIVGAGPAEASLRQQMPGALFLGERRGDELAAIYASLDVFAHSGPYETFGQTLQEAERVQVTFRKLAALRGSALGWPQGTRPIIEALPKGRSRLGRGWRVRGETHELPI